MLASVAIGALMILFGMGMDETAGLCGAAASVFAMPSKPNGGGAALFAGILGIIAFCSNPVAALLGVFGAGIVVNSAKSIRN